MKRKLEDGECATEYCLMIAEVRGRQRACHTKSVVASHVHNDLAGPLHNVGVVKRSLVSLPLDSSRASLGDSIIFCPFRTETRGGGQVGALTIVVGSTRRLATLSGRSMRRSGFVSFVRKEMIITKLM